MSEAQRTNGLEDLLGRIAEAADDTEAVSLGLVLEVMGRRSFGSALLAAGLVTIAPLIGDIPGVPTIMGILVVLAAGQMLLGRDRLWLPDWLLDRTVSRANLERALRWLRPPARVVDRVIGPRLGAVFASGGVPTIAVVCLLIGAAMPLLELIPFSATVAGLLLTFLSLALVARDGLLALSTLILTATAVALLALNL